MRSLSFTSLLLVPTLVLSLFGVNACSGGDPEETKDASVAGSGGASDSTKSGTGGADEGTPGLAEVETDGARRLFFADEALACHVSEAGALRCSDAGEPWTEHLPGTFATAGGAEGLVCGATTDGKLLCSSRFCTVDDAPCSSPNGAFTSVGVGASFACALDEGGSISCFGTGAAGETSPPTGSFDELSAFDDKACALSLGSATCWGNVGGPFGLDLEELAPGLSNIIVDRNRVCGLTPQGMVSCDAFVPAGYLEIEGTSFLAFDARVNSVCGLADGGVVHCSGSSHFSRTTPPSGGFTQIANHQANACGLRPDDTVECWGDDFGNGAGVEECLVGDVRLSLDASPVEMIDYLILNSPPAEGQSLGIGQSYWLMGEQASPRLMCTPDSATSLVSKNGDELVFDLSELVDMSACPGTPISGSLSTEDGAESSVDGTTGWVDTSHGSNGITGSRLVHVRYPDGSFVRAYFDESHTFQWGYLIAHADSPLGAGVICLGEASITEGFIVDDYRFSNLSRLDPCSESGSSTLTGCSRR